MSAATTIKIRDTRQPKLTRAVIRQIGERERLADVARHGADGGFSGFTYYTETVPFAAAHKSEILARLREDAESMGEAGGVLGMLAGFRCLNGISGDELADGLHNPRSNNRTAVFNALAWYAAEEIARELNPDV